jgi:uncharacterized membrane protein YfhO
VYKSIERGEATLKNCLSSVISADYTKYTPVDPDKDAVISYDIVVPDAASKQVEVFVFIPSDQYAREVKVKASGSSQVGFAGNETNRIVSLGTFTSKTVITVDITINNDADNLYTKNGQEFFYYVDTEEFKSAFNRLLKNPQYTVEEGYKNDHLKGSITTTKSSQTIMTTIPYDEGWTVLVDGVRVDYKKTMNALISFEIGEAGTHTLEFVYRPDALVLGSVVSIASLSVFALIWVFEKKFRKFIWNGRGASIGASIDEAALKEDPSLWEFSFYTYDPPLNEDDAVSEESPSALPESTDSKDPDSEKESVNHTQEPSEKKDSDV